MPGPGGGPVFQIKKKPRRCRGHDSWGVCYATNSIESTREKASRRRSMKRRPLERTQEFVKLISGVEVGFKLAGGEFFAQVVEAPSKQVERGGEDFLIS